MPTVPSTAMLRADADARRSIAGRGTAPRSTRVPSTRTSSTVGASWRGATRIERTRPATFTRSRQRGVGDRHASRHRRRTRSAPASSVAGDGLLDATALAGGPGAAGDDGRQRDPLLRLRRRGGTAPMVTLAWGRRETCSRIASAVLSCSTRCQIPRYFRSGRSTDTSVSPSASSRTTHSTAARIEPAVGAVDDLERHALQARASPLVGQLGGLRLVDREVHGSQLVGGERAGVLDGAGRGHVEPVDEHQHHVATQDRRAWRRRARRARASPPRARTAG